MLTFVGISRAELSVVFLASRKMRALNRRALGHDYVTDVVTFELGRDDDRLEGEIYVCPDEARRNARLYCVPEHSEILRCVAHGILHLTGYDDRTPALRKAMGRAEDKLLASAGISFPGALV